VLSGVLKGFAAPVGDLREGAHSVKMSKFPVAWDGWKDKRGEGAYAVMG
jgi:hypothetical protein